MSTTTTTLEGKRNRDPEGRRLDTGEEESEQTLPSKLKSKSNILNILNVFNNNYFESSSFKLVLLTVLVLQSTALVLITLYTLRSDTDPRYDVNHLIFVCQAAKFALSAFMEFWTHRTNTTAGLWTNLKSHNNSLDALKISIPALLYLIQTEILYIAYEHLSAPVLQVIYQGKLVLTALFSVVALNRVYNAKQWLCLLVLTFGCAIVALSERQQQEQQSGGQNFEQQEFQSSESNINEQEQSTQDSVSEQNTNVLLGLSAVFIACFSSAIAGVFFEIVLKEQPLPKLPTKSSYADTTTATTTANGTDSDHCNHQSQQLPHKQPASLWMRNMQLAFFSIIITWVKGLYYEAQADRPRKEDEIHQTSGIATAIGAFLFATTAAAANQGEAVLQQPYFHGFTVWVWILVALNAGGGLLVAAVIKYADNVLRGLAMAVSVVLSTLLSMLLFGTHVSNEFFCGAVMILTSVYLFNSKTSNLLPVTDVGNTIRRAALSMVRCLFPRLIGLDDDKKEDDSSKQEQTESVEVKRRQQTITLERRIGKS